MNAEKIKEPVVTVVMPVYNVEAYVELAVDSVLSQTFLEFELLIIDDASPDGSIALIRSRFSDPRIRIISQENRGLAGARNTGIREARGKYIAFLDSDDFWHKDKLKKHLICFNKSPNTGVTFSASMFVNEQSEPLHRIQTPYIKHGYTARNVFCRNPIGNGSAPVIEKSILERIAVEGRNKNGERQSYAQYFDEELRQSEDIDCWTRIAVSTATEFSLIDVPLTYYRVNEAGLSADVDTQYQTWLAFVEKLEAIDPDFVKEHGSAAKAFQCRYLARRCLSQAKGRSALKWCFAALRHNPIALMEESARTLTTFSASVLFAFLPVAWQKKMLSSML
ncbi:glycosyltransferase [Arenicella sp. 4NH20-0111]|uniref:glycosyltransferase family 2 protein n=1 Tax=Arenicella sp. 4NH20-0111 TaxID=3127648 RepID=UPI0031071865